VLALIGGLLGLVLLFMLTGLLQLFLPGLPITFNLLFLGLALVMSAVIGLIAGVVPAGQAANLNPINALHEE
jgi:putative ABC transport system permease protein